MTRSATAYVSRLQQHTKSCLHVQVVKGCWQLSGAHHGDRDSDRTAGEAAVRDFAAFQAAGVTTLDVADHYGPGEELIGVPSSMFLTGCHRVA